MEILRVENLHVEVEGKEILKGIDFGISKNEVCVLFGPNGAGKTTLLMSILGSPNYKITDGRIIFNGMDITNLEMNERASLGIGVAFQNPPEIIGVKLRDILRICTRKRVNEELTENELKLVEKFKLTRFLDRDINVGFSGGEKKRVEILQLLSMRPKLLLLDEPDSGVDVESLRLIGNEIQRYIHETGGSALIITHHGEILEHVDAKTGFILLDGRISRRGNPGVIFHDILKSGYRECVKCLIRGAKK